DGIEMVQSLLEMEIGEVVGDQLVAQEGGELFVLLQKRVFEVGAEDVMAVLARLGYCSAAIADPSGAARRKTASRRETTQVGGAARDRVDVAFARLTVHRRGEQSRRI